MRAFIALTRPLNLLIIVLTMVTMRYGLLRGLLWPDAHTLQQDLPAFVALVLSTVLIAAAGNVINDYFDTRIDRINKPNDVIVGRTVKRRVAMAGHLVLSGVGLLLGAWAAWRAGSPRLALIPAFAIGALWTYSTTFKRRLFIGNGLVATLTALVPLTVGLYEVPLLELRYAPELLGSGVPVEATEGYFKLLWSGIVLYTVFAFATTLVRELQKDMADVRGDEADGCRTVPIVLGMKWARALVVFYSICICMAAWFLYRRYLGDTLSFWVITFGVIAPMLVSAWMSATATEREGHVLAGNVMKAAMVVAIAYAWLLGPILHA
ncbi:MAG: geranylgeranylglycerol-phosphate geranylgeranyltransferase [Flavobacteriales bacterium]|nr:geranylgeranylglycerol-phosphate geranylgeranyltransferase [Flavobacteriales bacterium]